VQTTTSGGELDREKAEEIWEATYSTLSSWEGKE
jgi:hypothetical protein